MTKSLLFTDVGKGCPRRDFLHGVANMSFKAIRVNEILTIISKFRVQLK